MGDLLEQLAVRSITSEAKQTPWFAELVAGTGRAEGLDAGVRWALTAITADVAAERARINRDLESARSAQDRRLRNDERRVRMREGWRYNRAVVGRAFGNLFLRGIVAAIIVGLTPVAASFATIIPFLDNITPVVFFGGEAGATTGDGPWTLYSILVWCVGACLIASFVSDIALGAASERWIERLAIPGGVLGLAIFGVQWFTDTLAWFSWNFAPLLLAAGYVAACAVSGSRVRRARGAIIAVGTE